MSVVSNPKVTIQLTAANIVDAFGERVDLLCGQQTAAATATSGQLYENVQANTVAEIEALFGIDSELTNRILQYRAGSDGFSRLDVIPIDDDGAATKATATVTFGGTTAGEDGTYYVTICDKYQYRMVIDVVTSDTPTDVGDALVAAITALDNIPVTAVNAAGAVTITATNGGTVGNFYFTQVEGSISGLTTTLAGFSGGATEPTLTGIFDVVGDQRYSGIGWPEHWADEINIVTAFLENRFNVSNAILDGVAFMGKSDTYANVNTYVDGRNDRVLVVGGNNVVAESLRDGTALEKQADYTLSYFMGVRSKRLTTGAPISDEIVATSGRLDNIGGPSLASLPYFNTEDKLASPAPASTLYTEIEQQELESSGYTVIGTNRANNSVIMGSVVTPYTTDSAGNSNVSFHYLNYIDTGSVCREIFFNSMKARFVQSRLTEGDVVSGRNIENAETIKAHILGVYRFLANLALVQAGTDAESYFSENTTVTINLAQRSATIDGVLPIVTQLGTINYVLQFSFTLESGQQITV